MKGKPFGSMAFFQASKGVMSTWVSRLALVCGFLLLLAGSPVWGQESSESGEPGAEPKKQDDMATLAEKMNNPLSDLWLLFMQNDVVWYDGNITDVDRVANVTLLQPVLSMALTEKWRMIFRPVIPIVSFPFSGFNVETGPYEPIAKPNFGRQFGLSDMVLWTAFSNKFTPPFVFGFGPTLMVPTATYRTLGTGKFSMGPMALAFFLSRKWILGVVAQHWWSVAGDDKRADVSLTDIQYMVRYRITPATNIGCGPNIRINWLADAKDRVAFPIGIGGDTLIKLGRLPVRVGAEFHWYPVRPETAGPKYNLRVLFVPVVPAPEWSKKPLL
jgi:hypothetical protein